MKRRGLTAIRRSPRRTPYNSFGAMLCGISVVAFCLLLLWRNPLLFWNDDYEISVLPVFADVARSWSEGHLPLLSPYSWVCNNLAGEFQYGTFSVFVNAAVILIWKFPLSFPQQAAALSMAHLFILAAGAFLLARDRKLPAALSTMVALVAALNGWIICWGATDWFGALGARLVAVGVVGTGTRARSTTDSLAISLACAVRLFGYRWRISLHGFDARPPHRVVVDQVSGRNEKLRVAPGDAWRSCARFWTFRASVAGDFRLRPRLRARSPAGIGSLAMDCSGHGAAWLHSAMLDGELGGLFHAHDAACRHRNGLWSRSANRASRRVFQSWSSIRQTNPMGTSPALARPLALDAPSAGVFRWSFRWLPFFHLILALCAAEALRDKERRGVIALLLFGVTAVAMSILGTSGAYAFPFSWILLTLAAVWAGGRIFVSRFQTQ